METVGFIGLGKIGSAVAANIQKAGYPMVVYDIREEATKTLLERGARLAASPSEVARASDVTFTSLPEPKHVENVEEGADGILAGIKEGGIYVDLSTCGPDLVRRIEPEFRRKGAFVMDAPVLTSPVDAANRKLIVMVGGEREIFDRIVPILDLISDKVIYAGRLGSGCICKLVNNMMTFGLHQIIAEGLTLGLKAGVDLDVLMESGTRGVLELREPRLADTVFRGRFDPPGFTLALSRKDTGLATALGRQNNVPMSMANLAEQIAIQGMNRGWAEKDFSIVFLLQEEMAGVEARAPEAAQ